MTSASSIAEYQGQRDEVKCVDIWLRSFGEDLASIPGHNFIGPAEASLEL